MDWQHGNIGLGGEGVIIVWALEPVISELNLQSLN